MQDKVHNVQTYQGKGFDCLHMTVFGLDYNAMWPVSRVHYDIWEELLWAGSDEGVVKSFLGSGLERYSSYVAHRGPVRALASVDSGIVSAGGNSIQIRSRGGVLKWSSEVPNSGELLDMALSTATAELVVATQLGQLACVNMYRGSIQKQWLVSSPITKLANTLYRSLCCGNLIGELALRDFRDLQAPGRSIKAFNNGLIVDLAVSDSLVATTGSDLDGLGPENSVVKVFDLRKWVAQPVAELSVPGGARLVQWDPLAHGSLLVTTLDSHVQILDVGSGASQDNSYSVDPNSFVSSMSVSSTGNCVCFGTMSGMLYQWGDPYSDSRLINAVSLPTEGPALLQMPRVSFDVTDESTPLSSIGMPYYKTRLFSAFERPPFHSIKPSAPLIPSDIANATKIVDNVGYALNPDPKKYRRNQSYPLSERIRKALSARKADVPKFRSQQERDKLRYGKKSFPKESQELQTASMEREQLVAALPKQYERVEIKYSRFGVEDFDFSYYNQTAYSGLEPVFPNSYMNPLLQMLRFIEPFAAVLVAHCRGVCQSATCLSCSLGFLFQMLKDAQGHNCQAQNFFKSFSSLPQTLALGLLGSETNRISVLYSQMLQKCARFLLERLKLELNGASVPENHLSLLNPLLEQPSVPVDDSPRESVVDVLFGLTTETKTACACGKTDVRSSKGFSLELSYPLKVPADGTFADLLASAASRTTSSKAWCNSCKKYNSMTQTRNVSSLPPFLLVGCGVLSASSASGGINSNDESLNASSSANSAFVASNELEAARFWWQIERHQLSTRHSDSKTQFLPLRIGLKSIAGGKLKVVQAIGDFDSDVVVYDLCSTIVEVKTSEVEPRHLVSHCLLDTRSEDQSQSWFLFNDFLVQQVEESDVLSFKQNKVPVMLQYRRVDSSACSVAPWLESSDVSILVNDNTVLNPYTHVQQTCHPLLLEELPRQPGMLIAIDAEFVCTGQEEKEIRSDQTNTVIRPTQYSLARVSVIRGEGKYSGVPLIDDYVVIKEPIVDYLTEYSGIQPTDCVPAQSTHAVVPLKTVEKKMRCLVDLQCKFLGHMIHNDFRSINMVVPRSNIIDTGLLFYIPEKQRRLSLKYLSWYLLTKNIQQVTHDSIEDAKTTLEVYKKYLLLKERRVFEEILYDIYEVGQLINYKPVFPKTIETMYDKL